MKKLSRIDLAKKAEVLKVDEMKLIVGGNYDGGNEQEKCPECKCYGTGRKELGTLGKKDNSVQCWDDCLKKYEKEFVGQLCVPK